MALELADVVHAAHVGVRDLSCGPHFGVKLREARGIVIDVGGQELQGDRKAKAEIVGAIDLAHAAAAEPSEDAIPRVEDCSRCEASMIDVGGRQSAGG